MDGQKSVSNEGQTRICAHCGATFHGHFCPDCGTKVEEEITFCPVCGTDRTPGKLFCHNCGFSYIRSQTPDASPTAAPTPVAPAPVEVPTPAKEEQTPAPAPKPAPVAPKATATFAPTAPKVAAPRVATPVQTPGKKKVNLTKKQLTLLISAILVVATLLTVGIILLAKPTYIEFGEYPQTLKAEDVTITETQDERGYFLGSDGAYYAKVVASPFTNSGYYFSDDSKIGLGATYYFKVEPLRWRILEKNKGNALIACDSIIANMAYDKDGSGDYVESDVRAWLLEQFFVTAFHGLQKDMILTSEIEGRMMFSEGLSGDLVPEYISDRVFLLSEEEALDAGYAKGLPVSDYARATGTYMNSGNHYGDGWWWLRTVEGNGEGEADIVHILRGDIGPRDVTNSSIGVVPAMWVNLKGIKENPNINQPSAPPIIEGAFGDIEVNPGITPPSVTSTTFTTKVVDQDGTPISGVSLEFHKNSIVWSSVMVTDETGTAMITTFTQSDTLLQAVIQIPEGYSHADEYENTDGNRFVKIDFPEGETILTVTLNALQVPPEEKD